jgi:hypothetical protein
VAAIGDFTHPGLTVHGVVNWRPDVLGDLLDGPL